MRVFAILLTILITSITPGLAIELSGKASAVDADVIEIAGTRIMLFGMESVERKETCTIGGKVWECWPAAVRQLEMLVSQGDATCTQVRPPDRYGRILGVCTVNGRNLNEAMVRSGFAVARTDETTEFVEAEKAARNEKVGLWQGTFLKPWDFRAAAGILVDRP